MPALGCMEHVGIKPHTPCRAVVLLFLIATLHVVLLSHSIVCHSPTVDEGGHVLSGLLYWKTGRFTLYRVNPPLVKLIAGLPLLMSAPSVAYREDGAADDDWSDEHQRFVQLNSARYPTLIRIARATTIGFSVLGLSIVYSWSRSLFGIGAGVFAALLWSVSPNLTAWGAIANTDIGAVSLALAAMYAAWRWTRSPRLSNALVTGVLIGLAQLAKFSLLILYPCLFVYWIITLLRPSSGSFHPNRITVIFGLPVVLFISLFVINLGYAFDSIGTPLTKLDFQSHWLTRLFRPVEASEPTPVAQAQEPVESYSSRWLKSIRAPLPDQYILGFDEQKSHSDAGYCAYIRGKWYPRGFWQYYLYAGLIKVPLAAFGLTLLTGVAALTRRGFTLAWFDELQLILPPAAILVALSSQTGLNAHFRYLLPAIPFVIILVSRLGLLIGCELEGRFWPRLKSLVVVFLVWYLASAIKAHPHQIAYFNEVIGGPRNGWRHLADSNVDWGQDLYHLKKWMNANAAGKQLALAYYGPIEPELLGIEYFLPDDAMPDKAANSKRLNSDFVAISANLLSGKRARIPDGRGRDCLADRDTFRRWRSRIPIANIGNSIFVFNAESSPTR